MIRFVILINVFELFLTGTKPSDNGERIAFTEESHRELQKKVCVPDRMLTLSIHVYTVKNVYLSYDRMAPLMHSYRVMRADVCN